MQAGVTWWLVASGLLQLFSGAEVLARKGLLVSWCFHLFLVFPFHMVPNPQADILLLAFSTSSVGLSASGGPADTHPSVARWEADDERTWISKQ